MDHASESGTTGSPPEPVFSARAPPAHRSMRSSLADSRRSRARVDRNATNFRAPVDRHWQASCALPPIEKAFEQPPAAAPTARICPILLQNVFPSPAGVNDRKGRTARHCRSATRKMLHEPRKNAPLAPRYPEGDRSTRHGSDVPPREPLAPQRATPPLGTTAARLRDFCGRLFNGAAAFSMERPTRTRTALPRAARGSSGHGDCGGSGRRQSL